MARKQKSESELKTEVRDLRREVARLRKVIDKEILIKEESQIQEISELAIQNQEEPALPACKFCQAIDSIKTVTTPSGKEVWKCTACKKTGRSLV